MRISIAQLKTEGDVEALRELLIEYLSWAAGEARDLYSQDVDVHEMLESSMSEIGDFSPPSGRLLIARVDGEAAGMGSLKRIRDDACVIKRMYVRPEYRGQKIGRSLLDHLIQAAREIGYSRILLDSANFMKAAHPLYRSAGFKEIEPFPEAEMRRSSMTIWSSWNLSYDGERPRARKNEFDEGETTVTFYCSTVTSESAPGRL